LGDIARALRNMLRAARRDPLKAVLAVLFSPWHVGSYVATMLFLTLVIFFVVYDVIELLASLLHLQKNFPAQFAIDAGMFTLAGAALALVNCPPAPALWR
jgi:hypothetical protein